MALRVALTAVAGARIVAKMKNESCSKSKHESRDLLHAHARGGRGRGRAGGRWEEAKDACVVVVHVLRC